jgi:hypothetical protein
MIYSPSGALQEKPFYRYQCAETNGGKSFHEMNSRGRNFNISHLGKKKNLLLHNASLIHEKNLEK